jgi:hypothetical protein
MGAIMVVGLLGSCDALFTNIYKNAGLGTPSASTLSAATTSSLITSSGITTGTPSSTFYDTLTADPTTKAAVIATLDATIASSTDPAVVQPAIALKVDIELKTSGASDLLNNAVTAAATIGGSSTKIDPTTADGFKALIGAFIPTTISGTPGKITEIVNTLAGLKGDFAALASSVTSSGSATLTSGLDAGTLAQTAAVVELMSVLKPVDSSKTPTVGAAVEAALTAATSGTTTNIASIITIDEAAAKSLPSDTTVSTLFKAAGIDLKAMFTKFGISTT